MLLEVLDGLNLLDSIQPSSSILKIVKFKKKNVRKAAHFEAPLSELSAQIKLTAGIELV